MIDVMKEYSLESILEGSSVLKDKYFKTNNNVQELFERSIEFALEKGIEINNPNMPEYRYALIGPNNRGELTERNFVLIRPLKKELSFHIWRNEYNADLKGLNFKAVSNHNGPDWIVINVDNNENLDKIFDIIIELKNNTYR